MVVIGILIALSINNWNEERLKRIKEKEIVLLIYNELEDNSKYISSRIEEFELTLPYASGLLNLTGSEAKAISADSLAKYTVQLFGFGVYTPVTINLKRIIKGEAFNLIIHDSLQTMLSEYEILLDKTHQIYDVIIPHKNRWELIESNIQTFNSTKLLAKKYNFKTYNDINDVELDIDTKAILSNPKFAATVSDQLNFIHFLLKRFGQINNDITDLRYFVKTHYDL